MPKHCGFSKLLCKSSKWSDFLICMIPSDQYSMHWPPELAGQPSRATLCPLQWEGVSWWASHSHWSARGLHSLDAALCFYSSVAVGAVCSHLSAISLVFRGPRVTHEIGSKRVLMLTAETQCLQCTFTMLNLAIGVIQCHMELISWNNGSTYFLEYFCHYWNIKLLVQQLLFAVAGDSLLQRQQPGTKGGLRSAATGFGIRKDKATFRSCLNQLGSAAWCFVQGTESQEGRKESHRLRLSSFLSTQTPRPLKSLEPMVTISRLQWAPSGASRLRKNINFPLISRGNSESLLAWSVARGCRTCAVCYLNLDTWDLCANDTTCQWGEVWFSKMDGVAGPVLAGVQNVSVAGCWGPLQPLGSKNNSSSSCLTSKSACGSSFNSGALWRPQLVWVRPLLRRMKLWSIRSSHCIPCWRPVSPSREEKDTLLGKFGPKFFLMSPAFL